MSQNWFWILLWANRHTKNLGYVQGHCCSTYARYTSFLPGCDLKPLHCIDSSLHLRVSSKFYCGCSCCRLLLLPFVMIITIFVMTISHQYVVIINSAPSSVNGFVFFLHCVRFALSPCYSMPHLVLYLCWLLELVPPICIYYAIAKVLQYQGPFYSCTWTVVCSLSEHIQSNTYKERERERMRDTHIQFCSHYE